MDRAVTMTMREIGQGEFLLCFPPFLLDYILLNALSSFINYLRRRLSGLVSSQQRRYVSVKKNGQGNLLVCFFSPSSAQQK